MDKEQTWVASTSRNSQLGSEKPPGIRCNLSDFTETCLNRATWLQLFTQQIGSRATILRETKELFEILIHWRAD